MDKLIETHPFEPYIPPNARFLVMGTFPPDRKRWSMDFYYPNIINDFWRVMGLIYFNDKDALYNPVDKHFDLDAIKHLLDTEGIAMSDTGYRIHRRMSNASDKYLDIVQPVNLSSLLTKIPNCTDIATTGEKAADIVALLTDTVAPKMGEYTMYGDIRIWRMPSTSRAYPLALDKKAEFYRRMLRP